MNAVLLKQLNIIKILCKAKKFCTKNMNKR